MPGWSPFFRPLNRQLLKIGKHYLPVIWAWKCAGNTLFPAHRTCISWASKIKWKWALRFKAPLASFERGIGVLMQPFHSMPSQHLLGWWDASSALNFSLFVMQNAWICSKGPLGGINTAFRWTNFQTPRLLNGWTIFSCNYFFWYALLVCNKKTLHSFLFCCQFSLQSWGPNKLVKNDHFCQKTAFGPQFWAIRNWWKSNAGHFCWLCLLYNMLKFNILGVVWLQHPCPLK